MRSYILFLSGLSLFLSCSVLEDREACPCQLRFDVRKSCGLPGERSARVIVSDTEGDLREHDGQLSQFRNLRYETTVTRGTVLAGGCIGESGTSSLSGYQLRYPAGSPADSLYWISGITDASGETAILPLRIRKEHVRLTISFLLPETYDFPYDIAIRSTTAGINLLDGRPLPGPFHCVPEERAPGLFATVLPRQASPDDLVLEIYEKGGLVPQNELPLQQFIAGNEAFSWEDEDLRDLRIDIDYVNSSVSVSVYDWNLVLIENITI